MHYLSHRGSGVASDVVIFDNEDHKPTPVETKNDNPNLIKDILIRSFNSVAWPSPIKNNKDNKNNYFTMKLNNETKVC